VRLAPYLLTLAVAPLPGVAEDGHVAHQAADDRLAQRAEAPSGRAEWYDRGMRLVDQGRWNEALELWEEAELELAAEGVQDPRIGTAYIEVVVREEAGDRHDEASSILLWSLSGDPIPESHEELRRELERVLLVVDDDDRGEWERLREAPPREQALALKRYWIERDPTPSTATNERLVEHWTRIATARQRYVYNRRSPIGTDDRGVVYLRYGEPVRTRKGYLGASEMEMRLRLARDDAARELIRRLDTNPQYEVWVYNQLNDQDLSVFLFGARDGVGPFALVEGVHELIPSQARSRNLTNRLPGGLPAAYFLTLFYYEDLSHVGGIFGERFAEMDQLWNLYTQRKRSYVSGSRPVPQEGELQSLEYRYRMQDEFDPRGEPATAAWSEFEGRARDEIVSQVVRTLSDDDQPLLVVLTAAAPRLAASRAAAYGQRIELPGWTMRHTLIIRDEEYSEVGRLVQPVTPETADLSTFVLRHPPQPIHLTVTARTLTEAPEDSPPTGDPTLPGPPSDSAGGVARDSAPRPPGPDTLVASGRLPGQVHVQPAPPLTTDPGRFEMSDLIVGTPVPPQIDARTLPYDVLPSTTIWRRDALRVYLELYHLGLDAGVGQVDALFRVVPLTEDGEVDEDREPVTLDDVLLSPEGATYRQFFDIALRDQEPGRYRLEVEMEDRIRRQRVRRSMEFRLER
jgi:GWxTD domain-containing protein